MRVIVVGLGVQGHKRKQHAGSDYVTSVDPISPQADYQKLEEVPLTSYDAALLCVPDEPKVALITYLLQHGKHVLVEKPLWALDDKTLQALETLAHSKKLILYTAYNHRFEPHFMQMKQLLSANVLGKIYHCRLFYGNGTAKLVRDSVWRDKAGGVLPDLGSHLLDILHYWFENMPKQFHIVQSQCFENKSPDHVIFKSVDSLPQIECEMTLLSWRNHFTCDIFAEFGSAHISSLCKWGPSTFTYRKRILPSGYPEEESITLVKADPTWAFEYQHFKSLCQQGKTDLSKDIWLNRTIHQLTAEALDMTQHSKVIVTETKTTNFRSVSEKTI